MKNVLTDWYSDNPQISGDYCRIVTTRHLDRLQGMLAKTSGKVAIGGRSNHDDKFLEPTVITGVGMDDSTMQVYIVWGVILCVERSYRRRYLGPFCQ